MIDVNKGVWNTSQWKYILEFILMVPSYFPFCCASAAVPFPSPLSSEKLGNPRECLTEFVASGVLQEIPFSIHAPLVCQHFSLSLFSSFSSSLVWGLCRVSGKAIIISRLLFEMDASSPVLSIW